MDFARRLAIYLAVVASIASVGFLAPDPDRPVPTIETIIHQKGK